MFSTLPQTSKLACAEKVLRLRFCHAVFRLETYAARIHSSFFLSLAHPHFPIPPPLERSSSLLSARQLTSFWRACAGCVPQDVAARNVLPRKHSQDRPVRGRLQLSPALQSLGPSRYLPSYALPTRSPALRLVFWLRISDALSGTDVGYAAQERRGPRKG